MIANHFGWNWKEAFDRAGSGHEQSHDALTLSKYATDWPYWWECKYRQDWSFPQFFKDPEKSMAYRWFDEAITYTAEENLRPALAFSKPHQPIYWMTLWSPTELSTDVAQYKTSLAFYTKRGWLTVYRLEDYLECWGASYEDI